MPAAGYAYAGQVVDAIACLGFPRLIGRGDRTRAPTRGYGLGLGCSI
ncbi:hypothetical protein [Nostoc sp.]